MLYVEGNLETKVFTDPITGLARRIREVAVRRNGNSSLCVNLIGTVGFLNDSAAVVSSSGFALVCVLLLSYPFFF